MTTEEAVPVTAQPSLAECKAYWQRPVVWRMRVVARTRVKDNLLRDWAATQRGNPGRQHADPFSSDERVLHYGQDLPPAVVLELESLAPDDDDE